MSIAAPICAEDLQLRPLTPELRGALEAMYTGFDPKGTALGLPPRTEIRMRTWLDSLAGYRNFVMTDGELVVGHAVLCPAGDAAEVAVFVHQDYRGRGLGRRMLQVLLAKAVDLGLRRVWGLAEPDNLPMLRLAHSCGFVPGTEPGEFFLDLKPALRTSVLPQPEMEKAFIR